MDLIVLINEHIEHQEPLADWRWKQPTANLNQYRIERCTALPSSESASLSKVGSEPSVMLH